MDDETARAVFKTPGSLRGAGFTRRTSAYTSKQRVPASGKKICAPQKKTPNFFIRFLFGWVNKKKSL